MVKNIILWVFAFAGLLIIGLFFVFFQQTQVAPFGEAEIVCLSAGGTEYDFPGRVRSSFEAQAAIDDFMQNWEYQDSVESYSVSTLYSFKKSVGYYQITTKCRATPDTSQCEFLGKTGVTEDGKICRII